MLKKIVITSGGTGGHVFPAQGLAQQLLKDYPQLDILFMAGGLASNRYFDRSLFNFKEIACSPLVTRHPGKALKGCVNLAAGFWQSKKILKHFQPQVVVGFGSYYTIPVLLAAKWQKIPIVLHEANSVPGKANKWFAPYAQVIGVHFPHAATILNGRCLESNLPLRAGYHYACIEVNEARTYFGLTSSLPVILVFGGSQGAQAINQMTKKSLENFLRKDFQVIHLTGDEKVVDELAQFYKKIGIQACVKAFEKKMNLAWKAANFFIGRAGASTIAEAMEFEVPGILIPYPFATDQHQEKNADFFIELGGGVKCLEPHLTTGHLQQFLNQLLDPIDRNKMCQNIHRYKQKADRLDLNQLILKLIDTN